MAGAKKPKFETRLCVLDEYEYLFVHVGVSLAEAVQKTGLQRVVAIGCEEPEPSIGDVKATEDVFTQLRPREPGAHHPPEELHHRLHERGKFCPSRNTSFASGTTDSPEAFIVATQYGGAEVAVHLKSARTRSVVRLRMAQRRRHDPPFARLAARLPVVPASQRLDAQCADLRRGLALKNTAHLVFCSLADHAR